MTVMVVVVVARWKASHLSKSLKLIRAALLESGWPVIYDLPGSGQFRIFDGSRCAARRKHSTCYQLRADAAFNAANARESISAELLQSRNRGCLRRSSLRVGVFDQVHFRAGKETLCVSLKCFGQIFLSLFFSLLANYERRYSIGIRDDVYKFHTSCRVILLVDCISFFKRSSLQFSQIKFTLLASSSSSANFCKFPEAIVADIK